MTVPVAATESEDTRYEPDIVDDSDADDGSYRVDQYDITWSPSDFTTKKLVDLIDSGVVRIPGFQRNYVWDIKRASRLIESIIVGLPVPQIFLYEKDHNKFLVIDGQQRLMSIYYFVKERFPRKDKLADLRLKLSGKSKLTAELLSDDEYFRDFQLNLPANTPGRHDRFHKRRYSGLDDDYQTSFDIRTIRNILVRPIPPEGDAAMFEIFNRLNSGGVNLTPQEIRRCMYDSDFYEMLYRTNNQKEWRDLVGARVPDIHMKDVEILLRGFAMLLGWESYKPSMVKFLNGFSRDAKLFDEAYLQRLQRLLLSFLNSCGGLPSGAFQNAQGRFSPMIFESVFVAVCEEAYKSQTEIQGSIEIESLQSLKDDPEFRNATQSKTSDTSNVQTRLSRARKILELVDSR